MRSCTLFGKLWVESQNLAPAIWHPPNSWLGSKSIGMFKWYNQHGLFFPCEGFCACWFSRRTISLHFISKMEQTIGTLRNLSSTALLKRVISSTFMMNHPRIIKTRECPSSCSLNKQIKLMALPVLPFPGTSQLLGKSRGNHPGWDRAAPSIRNWDSHEGHQAAPGSPESYRLIYREFQSPSQARPPHEVSSVKFFVSMKKRLMQNLRWNPLELGG